MKVLVTNANGKVGQQVAHELVNRQIPVRIAAHTVSKAQAAFPNAEVVPFDFEDAASITAALTGITHLYLSTPSGYAPLAAKRVIDLAAGAGVQHVTYLSAMGVDASDEIPLRQVEKYLEASSLQWTILRPTWFMQNYSTGSAPSIKAGVLSEPAGEGQTGFIDTRDIAAVAVTSFVEAGHHGHHYALTGGELLDRSQAAAQISSAIGKPVQYVAQSDEEFRAAMTPYLGPDYTAMLASLYAGVRAGWTAVITPTVQEVLGRQPISFSQFAQDHKQVWS